MKRAAKKVQLNWALLEFYFALLAVLIVVGFLSLILLVEEGL